MSKSIFITGTDTDIGKTYVSCLVLKALNQQGYKTFAIKPIASGCDEDHQGRLRNQDALQLQAAASIKKNYEIVNPIAFKEPIAPHLAAQKAGLRLEHKMVKQTILDSLQPQADINLIEGVGGWAVPLNESELLADVIQDLNIPVILVVGIKLGCLNHAILTYQNILARNVPILGWIANRVSEETLLIDENIATLKEWIKHPCLAEVSYNAQHITLELPC